MNYRINPKTGAKLSLLGFGAMRLPGLAGNPSEIDEAEAIRMIRYAVGNGVNYVDTAFTYNEGESEKIVAKALGGAHGEGVYVATKMPTMRLREPKEHSYFLDLSRSRLNRDCIDYYLLHGMKERYWDVVRRCDTISFLVKKKAEGLIRNMGFSFHGQTFDFFREVLDAGPWDFVQIQLNYMDADIQAGVEGLKYAASKGLAVMIMEPLKGGKLTDKIPPGIQRYWDAIDIKRTPADWGLRWVANFPEVTVVLSGMSTMEQVRENVAILSGADAGCLSGRELSVIAEMAGEYNKLIPYACTACKYCSAGCPKQIDIPLVIGMRNEAAVFDCKDKITYELNHLVRKPPSLCVACGKCEEVCPQHLPVASIMKETSGMFEDASLQWWREYV
ncbi:MAG: aldo/keto reductase [Peptococcaceae bacterium]|jgi:predicted aldo/keto reductase-like oxidoreductase|nr:aldo/keto reductase [Peptococcaceae bacterium]